MQQRASPAYGRRESFLFQTANSDAVGGRIHNDGSERQAHANAN
jgi:hypothetical protein